LTLENKHSVCQLKAVPVVEALLDDRPAVYLRTVDAIEIEYLVVCACSFDPAVYSRNAFPIDLNVITVRSPNGQCPFRWNIFELALHRAIVVS
jgi:hypothetical protein